MKTNLFLLLFIASICLSAQNHKQGRVSVEELKKTASTIDPDAAAEVLYEKAYFVLRLGSDGRFELMKEYEGRIKIYDKDNVDESFLQQQVSLYSPNSSARERLHNFKGATYNLENGKAVPSRVRNADIFKERRNKYWESEKFTFPNVQNGSVLEYSYSITSPHYRDIGRWYFQQEIPVVSSEFNFRHPEFFIFNIDLRGEPIGKTKTNSYLEPNTTYNYVTNNHTFTNVPALKDEPYVFNANNLKASVRYELTMFSYPGFISENYATSWEQIAKDMMKSDGFGGALKGNRFLDETVNGLVEGTASPINKMEKIFQYVKNNYAWNNIYGTTTDQGIRSAFNDKSGNIADLNLMLVSMLSKAGLDAAPVALSTVGNLMINYSFPSRTSLNAVIASVVIDGKLYLMDATEKYSNINMLPMRDLNHRGFRISENGVQEISLSNSSLSTAKEVAMIYLAADGTISGNHSETRDAYFAMNDKMRQTDDPKKFEKRYLSNFNFDVEDFKINENKEKGMFRYVTKFENVQGAEIIGDKMILNPLLFSQLKKTTLNSTKRNYPMEFGSVISIEKIFKIKIPEGYAVESLPEEKTFLLEGNLAGYAYKVIEKEGEILVNTLYQIGSSSLPSSYYSAMQEFEKNQFNTESQAVVLKKI
ncbi:MAG TPA: hypothetical protein VL022_07260 [Moheibacter sp.]|nr:hypothetical protein [Moheibacter sp.]